MVTRSGFDEELEALIRAVHALDRRRRVAWRLTLTDELVLLFCLVLGPVALVSALLALAVYLR